MNDFQDNGGAPDMTDFAFEFFTNDVAGYGVVCELVNSSLSNGEIENQLKLRFFHFARMSVGTHITSKFYFHILSAALREIDWRRLTVKLVEL